MQELHTPMAFEVLLENMLRREYRLDIYEALQKSNLFWLHKLAYYYFNRVLQERLEEGEECVEPQVTEYLKQNREIAAYQYACWKKNGRKKRCFTVIQIMWLRIGLPLWRMNAGEPMCRNLSAV